MILLTNKASNDMSDTNTSIADLIEATTKLTDEVVLQKDSLKVAATTATEQAKIATNGAERAEYAAQSATQISGWDTVEDAVKSLLDEKAQKNAYQSTDLKSPIKAGDSIVKVDSANETVMFTDAMAGLKDVPSGLGSSVVAVSFGGGTSYNAKFLIDITGKDGRLYQTHSRGYDGANVSGIREINTTATPPRAYATIDPLAPIKSGESLLNKNTANIVQDYTDALAMCKDVPLGLSSNGHVISFGGGDFGSSYCSKFIVDMSLNGKMYHGFTRGYDASNVSEWREIYTSTNPPTAKDVKAASGSTLEAIIANLTARIVALESK